MAVKRTEEGLNPGRRSAAQRRTAALECDAKMRARSHDTANSFQKSSHSLYNSRDPFIRSKSHPRRSPAPRSDALRGLAQAHRLTKSNKNSFDRLSEAKEGRSQSNRHKTWTAITRSAVTCCLKVART